MTIFKNGLRITMTIIFLILFVIFLLPMRVRALNIGCIGGAAVCLGLAGITFFHRKFSALISRLWEHPAGKLGVIAAASVTAIFVIAAAVISFFMLRAICDKPKTNDTTLVVLGCQVRGTNPSLMLKRRLDTAYDYLAEHDSAKVVVSGGKGDDEEISEALCMRNYLVSRGIDESRIFMEDKSVNTRENLRFSKVIIEAEGLCRDITIVTDGFHQLRGDIFAKREGLRSYNLAAHTPWWLLPSYWVREWFGVAYYTIFK